MKSDELRRRAWAVRKLCILRPIVHEDAFNDLPVAMIKRFSVRLSEDLLCIYTLERKLGQGYQWKLALSKRNGFQSIPKTSADLELAAKVFLNSIEMESLEELKFSDGKNCGHAVTRAEFIPQPSEGYPALPLPGKDEAVFDRESVDGPRKIMVATK
tara:strand:- start:177 stop:647 length:471 start_codon:yes stop_codon:yes gene_type:complete